MVCCLGERAAAAAAEEEKQNLFPRIPYRLHYRLNIGEIPRMVKLLGGQIEWRRCSGSSTIIRQEGEECGQVSAHTFKRPKECPVSRRVAAELVRGLTGVKRELSCYPVSSVCVSLSRLFVGKLFPFKKLELQSTSYR